MTDLAAVSVDFEAPETREILRQAHAASPAIHNVVLTTLETGEHLPIHSDSPYLEETVAAVGIVQALLAIKAPTWIDADARVETPIQQLLLQSESAIIGVQRGTEGAPHAAVALGDAQRISRTLQQLSQVAARARNGNTSGDDSVLLFDANDHRSLGTISGKRSALLRDAGPLADVLNTLLDVPAHPLDCYRTKHKLIPDWELSLLYMELDHTHLLTQRIPFLPHHAVIVKADNTIDINELVRINRDCCDGLLRTVIARLLASGLDTNTELAANDQEWQAIVTQLRSLKRNDLLEHLKVGGFADHRLGDDGEMEDGAMVLRCQECIYYLPKRRWCDLPELPLPVEADWYCRLWKL